MGIYWKQSKVSESDVTILFNEVDGNDSPLSGIEGRWQWWGVGGSRWGGTTPHVRINEHTLILRLLLTTYAY